MNKILILLPNTNDLAESLKLDKSRYEVHILYASDEVAGKSLGTFDYHHFLAQPEFLTSYVDRAVAYVKKHGITAIIYSHDMSSVVASVVCEKTALPGPTLESIFCCLHKYYTRKIDNTDLWYDFIHLEQPAEMWKKKVRYPCFLKSPFLTASKGLFSVRSETEMVAALATLKEIVAPYFKGYSNFFKKYLDVENYPLAIENILIVEELVQGGKQYCSEGWVDDNGNFTFHCASDELFSKTQKEALVAMIFPPFTIDKPIMEKLIALTEDTSRKFNLRNTFFNIEVWEHEGKFTLVEVNGRIATVYSAAYKTIWDVSAYEAAAYLACGQLEMIRQLEIPVIHEDGQSVSALFNFPTRGEGFGRDFIDFDYARSGSIADGAYNNCGKGLALFVKEDSVVKQVSTTGTMICSFMLTDTNAIQLLQRARKVMEKAILRAEDLKLMEIDF